MSWFFHCATTSDSICHYKIYWKSIDHFSAALEALYLPLAVAVFDWILAVTPTTPTTLTTLTTLTNLTLTLTLTGTEAREWCSIANLTGLQASSYIVPNFNPVTHQLTGVKCRATSVAKKNILHYLIDSISSF